MKKLEIVEVCGKNDFFKIGSKVMIIEHPSGGMFYDKKDNTYFVKSAETPANPHT